MSLHCKNFFGIIQNIIYLYKEVLLPSKIKLISIPVKRPKIKLSFIKLFNMLYSGRYNNLKIKIKVKISMNEIAFLGCSKLIFSGYKCLQESFPLELMVIAEIILKWYFIILQYFTLGMKAQNGIRKARHRITNPPVNTPPNWDFTPLEEFTAVRLNYKHLLILIIYDK